MLVVGTGRTADGTEHFVLQNSWGANWGENGFMRMQM
jgi:KDEL-tailed cysteine endopeptidase